jgi:dual-specificity kinase
MKHLDVRSYLRGLMTRANRWQQIIPGNNTFLKNFVDLLKKIFVYDPAHRITAKQALQHPWLKEMAQPDDGTEAAKIRMERIRMEQQAQRHGYVRS